MNNKGSGLTPAQALDKLDALYEQSVVALRNAIGNYITSGELPDENARKQGLFVYPSLTVTWDGSTTNPPKTRAFGRFTPISQSFDIAVIPNRISIIPPSYYIIFSLCNFFKLI